MKFTFDADVVGPWVCSKVGHQWARDSATAIGRLDANGNLLAGVLYDNWNGANIMQHIAAEGNWATPWFLGMIFHYPFVKLKAKRTTAGVCSTNKKCLSLVQSMGFEYEGKLTRGTPKGDLLVFVMWPEKCKYLSDRYTKSFQ